MRKIGLLVLLQLLVLVGFTQLHLKGLVQNQQGEALAFANVVISRDAANPELIGTTVSAADGSFRFENLKAGTYQLAVSYVGFLSFSERITLKENAKRTIRLHEAVFSTEDVLVFASVATQSMPVTQTTLTKEDLEKDHMVQDIPFLLSMTPGLVENSETGIGIGYTGMRIRGTDPTRINVMINGIPLNDAESQVVYWVDLPDLSTSVDKIQIQRGVGTSSNGAAAFGASINLQTTTLNKEAYASVSSMAGSYQTLKNSISVGTGLLNSNLSFDARYSKIDAGSYIQHGFSDLESFYLAANYHGKKSLLRATIMHGTERTGITWWGVPGEMLDSVPNYNPAGVYYDRDGNEKYYDNQTDNYVQTHYQLHYSNELKSGLTWTNALHYTRGGGYYEQFMDDANPYHSTDFADYGLPTFYLSSGHTIEKSDLIQQKWVENDFYGFSSNLNYQINKFNLIGGISMNQYLGDHFGKIKWLELNMGIPGNYEWYRNNSIKTEASAFARLTWSIKPNLHLFGDVQYRAISYTMEGPDDDLKALDQRHIFRFLNPKLGAKYYLNDRSTFYASYAIANREPARADFKEAIGDIEATPKSERLVDFEAGFEQKWKKAQLGINFYHMNYENQLVPTGEKSNVGYDIMTNVPESYRMGIELSGGVEFKKHLIWEGNLSLSKNKIRDYIEYAAYYDSNWDEYYLAVERGETNLSYSPEVLGNSRLTYSPSTDWQFTFTSKYVGDQYFDNTSSEDRKLEAYFVHHVGINYSWKPKFMEQIDFMLQIKNLFNQSYISNAYGGNWYENAQFDGNSLLSADERTWAYYFPQAGIQIYGGITLRF
jgi:iron complex outermembrane recepter protein